MQRTAKFHESDPQRSIGMRGWLGVALFLIAGLGVIVALPFTLIGFGMRSVITQDHAIRSAEPVEATIVSAKVGGRGPVDVMFEYSVAGRAYQSRRMMPDAIRGKPKRSTAAEFVATHPPGTRVTAYVLRETPDEAFLLRQYNDGGYIGIYIGLATLAFIGASELGYVFVRTRLPVRAGRQTWHVRATGRPLHARVKVNSTFALIYLAIWSWTAHHAYTHMPAADDVVERFFAWAATLGMSLPGAFYLYAAVRSFLTQRAVSDARVSVDSSAIRIGDDVQVRVEQTLNSRTQLQSVRLGLQCIKFTRNGKSSEYSVIWESWQPLSLPARVAGLSTSRERPLDLKATLAIPSEHPPTGPRDASRYHWKLIVETALAGAPDYRDECSIEVLAADDSKR